MHERDKEARSPATTEDIQVSKNTSSHVLPQKGGTWPREGVNATLGTFGPGLHPHLTVTVTLRDERLVQQLLCYRMHWPTLGSAPATKAALHSTAQHVYEGGRQCYHSFLSGILLPTSGCM